MRKGECVWGGEEGGLGGWVRSNFEQIIHGSGIFSRKRDLIMYILLQRGSKGADIGYPQKC